MIYRPRPIYTPAMIDNLLTSFEAQWNEYDREWLAATAVFWFIFHLGGES